MMMDILNWVSKEEMDNWLLEIIAIESHTDYAKKESEVAHWLSNFFEKENIPVRLEEVAPNRPNVIAALNPDDKDTKTAKLMFNGHTDTVPGYEMEYPAYEPFIKDGKVYGRGSADMKGAIVAMLAAFAAAKRSQLHLKESVIFSGVVDEEEQSIGAEDLVHKNYQAEHIIIGEPTQLDICTAHKGLEWVEFTFFGKPAHASTPREGANAVYMASEFCKRIENELIPTIESRFNDQLGSGSISVGGIQGGNLPNIVPDSCKVVIDRSWMPEENLEDVNQEMITIAEEIAWRYGATVDFRVMDELTSSMGNHPYQLSNENEFLNILTGVTEEVTQKKVDYKGFPAWSDAGILGVQTNAKCYILGPGNIEQAHAADEYCSLEEIYQASEIYFKLIQSLEEEDHE